MTLVPWHTLLRCPVTKSPLAPADDATVARINAGIAARTLVNRAGETVDRALDGALLNADRTLAYPIYNDIPSLIAEDALEVAGLG